MGEQRTTLDDLHLLALCRRAARAGGELIAAAASRRHTLDWEVKRPADFVSEVDRDAESRIADVLQAGAPDAVVVGEEHTPDALSGGGVTFIVDPLDGTTNFLHGYPQYAVSIAAVVDGELRAGVVLDAAHQVEYHAARGHGAWCGSQRLAVSTIADPSRALVGTGFPFKHPALIPRYLAAFGRVMGQTAGVRRAGAAALDLADVAAGRFDAFWELVLAPWDMAAGILLIREAGGIVTTLSGDPTGPIHGGIVASNSVMHSWLLAQLRNA